MTSTPDLKTQQQAIQVYSWPTPNGHKVHIMLEECKLPYDVHPVNIGSGEQFTEHFLSLSPNNKIPAILDPNGPDGKPMSLFESGAILIYLAGKTGRFLGKTDRDRFNVLQWLMFQMGGVGPMLGQAHHFRLYAPERIDYAINRYTREAQRLYAVLDKQLDRHEFLTGRQYTIADISTFPWIRSYANQGVELSDYPNVQRWFDTISSRTAVQRGLQVLAEHRKPQDAAAKEFLFGAKQYQRR